MRQWSKVTVTEPDGSKFSLIYPTEDLADAGPDTFGAPEGSEMTVEDATRAVGDAIGSLMFDPSVPHDLQGLIREELSGHFLQD